MSDGTTWSVLLIVGMRDNSCREQVAEVLGRINGVQDVSVSLVRARAVVAHSSACQTAALVRAVEEAGYVVLPDPSVNRAGGTE